MEFPLFESTTNNCREARTYYFSWAPNGNTDPVVTDARYFAPGASACNYAAGSIIKFTMIDSNFLRIISFGGSGMNAVGGTGQGFTLEIDTTNTDLLNGVLAFAMVNAAGTRADVAADANSRFFVEIILSKDYGDA